MADEPHPIERRWRVEELVRRRLPEEGRRYAAAQRRGRIDANPHQIDAVVFALRRIPEGGCILADEVGLGKTIETGLVLSQLLAEGMRRVLLIVPKSLLGQWKAELYDLFGIDAREVRADPDTLAQEGVFLVHRELAGSEKGAPLLWASDPFDLIVIDEAHELFAGIHKRFGKDGLYDANSRHAQTAHRVRELQRRHRAAMLLLTATPIQNSLLELWGLVQYVEPTDSLLGRLTTFRERFCDESARAVAPGQAEELRRRLRSVLHRTLRRQADPFLAVPFVRRSTRLIVYEMSADERALYDDVSAWLLAPERLAIAGSRLVLIGFLRRLASSFPAFAVSLRRVAKRVRALVSEGDATFDAQAVQREWARALEEEDLEPDLGPSGDSDDAEVPAPDAVPPSRRAWYADLEALEGFATRAESLPHDTKARCFIDIVNQVRESAAKAGGSGKLVVFTESIATQEYLERLLLEAGVPRGEITLFRGQNEGPRAAEALLAWEREIGSKLSAASHPSRDVAMRLALVHEFRTRSSIFISTEAGAKGLNLQFCETLLSYDLPWNPQRIEQRIGRVHRYGQTRDVTVVSFLAADNEAERLLFEILSQKLELFGTVLDASDAVLHEGSATPAAALASSIGPLLQREVERIYAGARSMREVTAEMRGLQRTLDEERRGFEEEQARVASLIETRLDDTVQQVFRGYEATLASAMAEIDHDLDDVLGAYLRAARVPHRRTVRDSVVVYEIEASDALPARFRRGGHVRVGRARWIEEGDVVHVGHPLIDAAIAEARDASRAVERVVMVPRDGEWPDALAHLRGARGRYVLTKISHRGLEPVDQLLHTALVEGHDAALDFAELDAFLRLRPTTPPAGEALAPRCGSDPETLEAVIDAQVREQSEAVSASEHTRYQRMLRQLDGYLADQAMLLRRREKQLAEELVRAQSRREAEASFGAREKHAAEAARLAHEIERLRARAEDIERGEDADYQAWVARLRERRFTRAVVERLVEVDFVLGEVSPC
jgi:hypothetical protein